MATTLDTVNSGSFRIDGETHVRGYILPYFDTVNYPNQMKLAPINDRWGPIVNFTHYSDYINGSTGLAFATMEALQTYAETYIALVPATSFTDPGTINSGKSFVFNIVDPPTTAMEKAPGATLQSDLLADNDNGVRSVIVDSNYYMQSQVTYTKATGTIAIADLGDFAAGMQVIVNML